MRAVVLDALVETVEIAERAGREESSAMDALVRYMHAALDLRVSAVIPALLDVLDLDDAVLLPARDRGAASVQRLVDAAHAEGSLADQVTFADVGMMLVRLSRPLPGPLSDELNAQLGAPPSRPARQRAPLGTGRRRGARSRVRSSVARI